MPTKEWKDYFPKDKIILTGNPVRQDLLACKKTAEEIRRDFGLNPSAKHCTDYRRGSLGARTNNESVLHNLKQIEESETQIIWQTGGYYFENIRQTLEREGQPDNLYVTDFITHMDEAYAAADVVISKSRCQQYIRIMPAG